MYGQRTALNPLFTTSVSATTSYCSAKLNHIGLETILPPKWITDLELYE